MSLIPQSNATNTGQPHPLQESPSLASSTTSIGGAQRRYSRRRETIGQEMKNSKPATNETHNSVRPQKPLKIVAKDPPGSEMVVGRVISYGQEQRGIKMSWTVTNTFQPDLRKNWRPKTTVDDVCKKAYRLSTIFKAIRSSSRILCSSPSWSKLENRSWMLKQSRRSRRKSCTERLCELPEGLILRAMWLASTHWQQQPTNSTQIEPFTTQLTTKVSCHKSITSGTHSADEKNDREIPKRTLALDWEWMQAW